MQMHKSTNSNILIESSSANSLDDLNIKNEQRIYTLIKEVAPNDETTAEIFNLIKDINWANFNYVDDNASIELLDWIDKNKIANESSITNLLMATKGLDGAFAEKYSAITAKIFLQDKYLFFICLSKLPAENIDTICAHVAYGCSYFDVKQIGDDISKMLITKKMSDQEIIAANKLINLLKEYPK
jgi:hypothetical protein